MIFPLHHPFSANFANTVNSPVAPSPTFTSSPLPPRHVSPACQPRQVRLGHLRRPADARTGRSFLSTQRRLVSVDRGIWSFSDCLESFIGVHHLTHVAHGHSSPRAPYPSRVQPLITEPVKSSRSAPASRLKKKSGSSGLAPSGAALPLPPQPSSPARRALGRSLPRPKTPSRRNRHPRQRRS